MKGDTGMRADTSLARIFGIPALVAVVSLVGLASALFGDGGWDAASWVGLAVPVGAVAWAYVCRRVIPASPTRDGGRRPGDA